jgi:hypothetical protein
MDVDVSKNYWYSLDPTFLKNKRGCGCFPNNAKVILENNKELDIGELKIGDKILSYDSKKKEYSYSPVIFIPHPKTTEEKIKEVIFNPMRPSKIKGLTDTLFGHSFDPEIVKVPNFFLEKLYTPYNKDSGVFIFSTDLSSFTFDEIDKIKTILQGLSNQLLDIDPETNNPRVNPETNQPTGHLFRHQIFESLKEFNINNLILIDLTCNAYTQTNPDYQLNTTIVNWLNGYLTHHNLRGGKYKKKLRSKKCKRTSKKCKRRSIKSKKTTKKIKKNK